MQKQFSIDGVTMHYLDMGEGKTVLLLHGFAEDHRVWDKQGEVLQHTCRVLIPDLPGTGLSFGRDEEGAITALAANLDKMADFLVQFIKFIQRDTPAPVIILGHSMGGYIALAIAEKAPEILAGFGLVHSTAFADTAAKTATRQKAISFVETNGAYSFLRSAIPGLFGSSFKINHPELVEALVNGAKRFSSEIIIAYYQAMIARPDRTAVLSRLAVPVLFIAGTEDAAVPLADVAAQAKLPGIAHLHVLEGAGHMGMLEEADVVNKILVHFIDICSIQAG